MKYFFGMPHRQWRYAAGMLFLAAMMAFFGVFAFMGAYHEESQLWMIAKAGVGLGAAWGTWVFATSVFSASIAPYFDQRIGGISTFGRGQEVARNCRRLDALAAEKGVRLISDYGYADDLRGETLVWHDPRAGIETVSALIGAIETSGADAKLAEELINIRKSLELAADKGAKFSFILRSGDGSNSMEHEQRKGSFF